MPNRMLKESIRSSRSVNNLSDFQFRLWIYLITYVDDYGRGSADPELLKGFVFPRRRGITESQIKDALSVLANSGMITLYEVDGESYFYFPKWGDHQRIQTKYSKFPDPPSPTVSHGGSPCKAKAKEEVEVKVEHNASQCAPAREDVIKHCKECGYTFSASEFYETYSSSGWTIKGEPIQDWKALAAAWERKEKSFETHRRKKDYGFGNYEQRPVCMEDLKDIVVVFDEEGDQQ